MISMNYSAPKSLKDVTNKKKHLIRAVRRKCPKIVDIHLSTADELIAWQRPYTSEYRLIYRIMTSIDGNLH